MKSTWNKSRSLLLTSLILATLGSTAVAGVTAMPGLDAGRSAYDSKRVSSEKEMPASSGFSTRNRSDSVIRCWQDGQLIFDERDWQAAGGDLGGPVLNSKHGPYSKMRFMQFADTFCALQYGAH